MTDTTVSEDTADAGAQASTWSADDVVQLVRSAARLGLSAETAIDLRERGLSLAEARDELINRRAEADEKIMTRAHRTEVGISYDSPDALMSRMTDALLNRLVPAKFDLPEHAREFRGASIADLKARLLSARGVNVRGLTADEILTRGIGGVHTTSDLPQLLSNTLNKSLDQHEADNQTPLKQFSREKSATDFKEMLAVRTGTTSLLQVVHESGEFKRGVFAEEASGFSLKTAGLIWGISRQALVNDDLSALADISDEINTVVAEYEASVLVGLLVGAAGAGAVCGDGVTLFHGASHGNVGTDGVPSVTTLSELRQLLRAQRTIGDKVLAGSTPKAVIAPPALETTFEQLLFGTLSAPNAAAINPFAGALQLYVEPRLTDSERWYVVSGEFLSHAYLQGQRGAQIATREGFDTDGVEIRARLDFGATVRDWRRIAKNDGAAPGA